MIVYPATRSKNGNGNGVVKASGTYSGQFSAPHYIIAHAPLYSGIICIKAIARNTPPLKAFAIPKIVGDSLKDLDLTGRTPKAAASINERIMKIILTVDGSIILVYY